jgi:outer membrane lipoprotein SlyB
MKHKNIISFLVVIFCLLISACGSKDVAPGDYDASEVGKIKKVVPGVIISKRPVNIHIKSAENLATSPDNNAIPTPPADTDNSLVRSRGYEYVIRLNSGTIISIVQTEDVRLKTQQRILVIYGNNTRVVPDEGENN